MAIIASNVVLLVAGVDTDVRSVVEAPRRSLAFVEEVVEAWIWEAEYSL